MRWGAVQCSGGDGGGVSNDSSGCGVDGVGKLVL